MENNQLLPFERNRYYVGKLLTSADFQAEQIYGSHKRRFLNEMMFGSGIVCGLGVYSLDDLSVMVDSGVAMDGCGREVVLDSSVVKKLSAIEGFETLETDRAVLCLAYQEEAVHPVYAMRGQENGEAYEHNRIREGCRLLLRDAATVSGSGEPEPEFLAVSTLYEDADYSVTCAMPAQSACGSAVRLDVTVRRLKKTTPSLTMTAVLQAPAFTTEDGSHELTLEFQELCPEEAVTLPYWLTAQTRPTPDCVLLADQKNMTVQVGGEFRTAETNFALKAAVTELSAAEIVDQAAASASLELRLMSGGEELVPLALISMQRTRNAYIIEQVELSGVRRYIHTAAGDGQRREMSGWFRPARPLTAGNSSATASTGDAERYAEPLYATGTCNIPLNPNSRRGQTAYSDEIVHGLGVGTVYVSVGAEYLADDPKMGAAARNTIYGDVSLFPGEQTSFPSAELAVKVMNDRGSFVVAARLPEETSQVVLPLRWVAIAMPGGEESAVQKLAGKSISAVQPTVVLAIRESHYFNVRFKNMEPCTLTYELTEKDSGEITSDGIYTAPGREGVFEIRISCAELPLISTYAYAVVKKRDAAQTEDAPQNG